MKRRHILILSVLTALLWLLTDIVEQHLRHEFAPWPRGQELHIEEKKIPRRDSLPLASYLPITQRNLFGDTARKPTSESLSAQKMEQIPIAKRELPIALMGTVASGDSVENMAIILDKKKSREGFYRKDDVIHGYRIERILPEAVLISKDGEKLRLLTRISKAYLDLRGISSGNEIVVAPEAVSDTSPQTTTQILSGEDVRNSLNDMDKVLESAVISAYNGPQGKGVRLTGMKPDSIYKRLALQNNDVILSINGAPLTNAVQAMKLYSTLNTAADVTVVILRNNQVLNKRYVLN